MMLAGKRIVLGVTGGIAAYKAIEVSRRLVDLGAHVVPVMTEAATRFIGETTLSALASEPVKTRLWDDPETPIPHTKHGQGADLVLVAPATARFIGAIRAGISDDLLSNIVLASRAPIMIAPAMHTEMWEFPAVVDNVRTLTDWGIHVVPPESGRLAGGDVGAGRLAAPETIVTEACRVLGGGQLAGQRVVISAGGTREPIDSVRVIANRSSGKQGYALAAEAYRRGADVTLVSTADLPTPCGVELVPVETCEQMRAAMHQAAPTADVVVMAAAVADFAPLDATDRKLKKRDGVPQIELEPTTDILAELGANKPAGQVLVGFAAETNDVIANAASKLDRKRLDMIVANDVSAPRVGFGHDTNEVTILVRDRESVQVPLSDKRDIASAVLDAVATIRTSSEENHGPLDV